MGKAEKNVFLFFTAFYSEAGARNGRVHKGIVNYSIAGHLYLYQYGYDFISHYSEAAVLLSVPASDHGRW